MKQVTSSLNMSSSDALGTYSYATKHKMIKYNDILTTVPKLL